MLESKREKVIRTARDVFMRYGYRRVTMNDLAEAANMSRPALYLVFPSKEEIFTAVMTQFFEEKCAYLYAGIESFNSPAGKLTFAFEVWCIQPFEMILASPDAKDLLESSYQFAAEVTAQRSAEFVDIVAGVLEPLVREQSGVNLSSLQIARLLASAVLGFKASAVNAAQFRQSIAGMITIVLASLQQNAPNEGCDRV